MTTMPQFNFGNQGQLDATPEEIAKAETREFTNTRFEPGRYQLKVVKHTPHKASDKDPNWFVYKTVLSIEGVKVVSKQIREKTVDVVVNEKGDEVKSLTIYPMVPVTANIKYNPEHSKNPLMMYIKFKQFMGVIGVAVDSTLESIKHAVSTYFANPSNLEGKVLDVELAYTGPRIKKEGDKFIILNKDDTPFTGETFPSKELAEAVLAEKRIKPVFGVEIVKFFPPAEPVKEPLKRVQW